MFGVPALRSEDPRFLRGEGRYLENIPIPDALRAVFVRSIMPHGRVGGIEGLEGARSMPGVVAVFTADDLRIAPQPPSGNVEGASGTLEGPFAREVLARDTVRYVGEPVAVVIADSLAHGQDAAEVVWPVVDALDAVTDVEAAFADGAPVLFPAHGSNIAHSFEQHWDADALAGADVVARARVVQQRLAPVPMETNAIAVVPEDDGGYTIWCSTQVPFDVRSDLAELLEVDKKQVRIVAPDVGGGFGAKLIVYPEFAVVAAAAKALGRPVRWAETRSESMLNLNHGRAQVQRVEIGAKRDGTVVGMRVELLADMGAYPVGAFLPTTTQEMLAGVYTIPVIASRGWSVVTNATPVAAYRGAGRPEATALVERAMDLIAAELGMDPVDVRRKNMIPADVFPYRTASGTTYDIGNYELALDEALKIADVPKLRAEQAARRERGDHLLLGIGVSTYVEITAFASKEFGSVQVHADGTVTVLTGVSPQGQGHETAMAQIASAVLGVPFETVRVVHSDSAVVPRGAGTWGSRSLQVGGSAVAEQTQAVVAKARTLASHLLEVDEADLPEPRRRTVRGRGSAGARDHVGGARGGRGRPVAVARGHDSRTRRVGNVPRVGVDVPVRRARGGRRGRRPDRRRAAGAPRRRRRLRPDPQPDARGRAGARRAGAGHRAGAVRGGPLRRDREPGQRQPVDVRHAGRVGAAVVRDRAHGDADAVEPVGREGDRRIRHDRVDPGRAERGDRRAVASGRAPHRPAALARTRVARDPRGIQGGALTSSLPGG